MEFARVSGLCVACCVAVPSAKAQPVDNDVEFARLTWTEVAAAVRAGTDTIIIPIGGTEQSGPYIAVGKHNVRAQVLAARIARELGHTLVAPVVAYVPEGGTNPRTSHMRFPGTISIPPAAFTGLLEGAAESFHVQGFRRIVFIADHGGYLSYVKAVATHLDHEWRGAGRAIYVAPYYDVIATRYADALRAQGLGADVGKHADLSDTALMLAVDPGMVRETALRAAPLPGASAGVYGGDPRPATAALGRIGVDMQVQAAVDALRREH
ncbi:creatininase [Neoasaia chiangmaiensis NBRC 101099]|uniref:Creatininase n=1 Tax=Neoasaia chiangmaiensis TaxID=320497 RepID=A0A1U9KRZ7_9PROT|nr:creatininase family protein [Neoasaia chiangmaiensis]AQS88578.1 creatininase [Neoasaia chiangmaiensis]GBR36244.1 creatininase [Neoasaia chiangmaiensis NBRC 101099]